MAHIHLVHWNKQEAQPLLDLLRAAGHHTTYETAADSGTLRKLRASPPGAVLIDLSRLPSHGREFAIALRGSKATRHVPLVFTGGDPLKVAKIREQLPDAAYTESRNVLQTLEKAIAHPPDSPVLPAQMMDRYAARTAAQKLGIQEGSRVALVGAPRNYEAVIGEIPPGVVFDETGTARRDVTLWFPADPDEYRSGLPGMRAFARKSKLWILWRKQKGRGSSPLNERLIRESALDVGLVDYKICSVDSTWSALLFALAREE